MSSVIQILRECNQHSNYVPPVDNHTIGWRAYFSGVERSVLMCDSQRNGWDQAQAAAQADPGRFAEGAE